MTTIPMGNNETAGIGISAQGGRFIAVTLSASKWFKTYAGAVRWLADRGYNAEGGAL